MIDKLRLTIFFLLLSISLLSRCQGVEEDKFKIVDNHIQNDVLEDIILTYKDVYGELPSNLNDLIKLYKEGNQSFGFDSASISNYIIDPFSDKPLRYYKLSSASFIVYSVGPDGLDDNSEKINRFKGGGLENLDFTSLDSNTPPKGDILIYYHVEK